MLPRFWSQNPSRWGGDRIIEKANIGATKCYSFRVLGFPKARILLPRRGAENLGLFEAFIQDSISGAFCKNTISIILFSELLNLNMARKT